MASQRKRPGRRLGMGVDDAKSELACDALRRITSASKSRVNALRRRTKISVNFSDEIHARASTS